MPAEPSSALLTTALSVLPWILVVTSTTLTFPQIWMSCIRGRTQGLDLTASMLAPTLSAAWLVFGLLLQDQLQIVANSLTLVCNLAILAALMLRRADTRTAAALNRALPLPMLLAFSVLALTSLAWTGLLSPATAGSAVGMVTVGFSVVALVPQPVALLRDRTQDMSGISLGRFGLSVMSNSLWITYGVLASSPIIALSAVLGTGSSLVVVYCVLTRKRHVAVPSVHQRAALVPVTV